MEVGRSCFSSARQFVQFERGRNLAPPAKPQLRIDLAALCLAYCYFWIQQASANQRFMVSELVASRAMGAQPLLRAKTRGTSLAALPVLGGSQTNMGMTLVLLLSQRAIKTCLDAYAAQGGSFVMLTLERSRWTHAIAIKLNRSAARPSVAWGYPCAIFDPNVGQGVYSNHDDLAADLLRLVQAYGMVSSIAAQVLAGR